MKGIPKVIATIAIVLMISVGAGFITGQWEKCDLEGQVVIVHTNDSHGYYNENLGFTSVASIAKDYQSRGATVFVVDAGDAFQGTASTMLTHGHSTVPVMNAVGYDLMVPGNHEFDYTLDTYLGYVDELSFPTICANVDWKETGESVFDEYMIIEKGGVRVGFFGLLTQDTMDAVYYGYLDDVTITDPVEAASEIVGILEGEDVDYIVAVGHLGLDSSASVTSADVCSAVSGIDVFIDGHSHTEMEHGEVVDGSIQIDSGDTLIASTGCYIECVGVVTLSDDPDAILIREWGSTDPAVDSAVNDVRSTEEGIFEEVLGSTLIDLDGERSSNRTVETNLGDLTADSLRWLTGAEIAIVNGGMFRASIPIGEVDMGDVYAAIPFENLVGVKMVDGATLIDALEKGFSGLPGEAGCFPQVSGIDVVYDSSAEVGSRVVSVTVGDSPLNPDRIYTVASIGYILDGGDGYTMFIDMPYTQMYGTMIDCLADYIRDLGIIEDVTMPRLIDIADEEEHL